jgi:hypothetical protein
MAVLKQPIIEKLAALRLLRMAEGLKVQEQDPIRARTELPGTVRLIGGSTVNWRENPALSRFLNNAKLRTPNACVHGYFWPNGVGQNGLAAVSNSAHCAMLSIVTPTFAASFLM